MALALPACLRHSLKKAVIDYIIFYLDRRFHLLYGFLYHNLALFANLLGGRGHKQLAPVRKPNERALLLFVLSVL
jgi:hypothetical protein